MMIENKMAVYFMLWKLVMTEQDEVICGTNTLVLTHRTERGRVTWRNLYAAHAQSVTACKLDYKHVSVLCAGMT